MHPEDGGRQRPSDSVAPPNSDSVLPSTRLKLNLPPQCLHAAFLPRRQRCLSHSRSLGPRLFSVPSHYPVLTTPAFSGHCSTLPATPSSSLDTFTPCHFLWKHPMLGCPIRLRENVLVPRKQTLKDSGVKGDIFTNLQIVLGKKKIQREEKNMKKQMG